MLTCQNCQKTFPKKIKYNGKTRYLTARKFCLECSPLGENNTRSYIIKLSPEEAFCARCNKTKSKKEFYIRKDSGKPFSYCVKCQEIVKNLKFEEKLESIVLEKGAACLNCKISFPSLIYEFCNQDNVYRISRARNISLDKLRKELKNYDMLCRNCSAISRWEMGKLK